METVNMLSGAVSPGTEGLEANRTGNRLFDAGYFPVNGLSAPVTVSSPVVAFRAFGLVGAQRAVLYAVDVPTGKQTPVVRSGVQAYLSADNTELFVDIPGVYKLKAEGFTATDGVVITYTEMSLRPLERPALSQTVGSGNQDKPHVYLEAHIPVDFDYQWANQTIDFSDVKRSTLTEAFGLLYQGNLSLTDGLFWVQFQVRIVGMTGGSYGSLVMKSLNGHILGERRESWGEGNTPTSLTLTFDALISSSDVYNYIFATFITDATTGQASFMPLESRLLAIRVADAQPALNSN